MRALLSAGIATVFAVFVLWRPATMAPVMSSRSVPSQLGSALSARRTRSEAPATVGTSLYAELLIAVLASGSPASHALETLDAELAIAGLSPPRRRELIIDALELAEETGVSPTPLIRSTARQERRRASAASASAAARLGVQVLLPMGLCLLPAFMVLTVVPLVIGLLG